MIPNGTWVYSEFSAQPNCHQRGFLRQLMVTGAETYNQTLGADGAQIGDPYQVPSSEAWKLHRRGRRRIVETRETKDTSRM